jgi:hypothetical protein
VLTSCRHRLASGSSRPQLARLAGREGVGQGPSTVLSAFLSRRTAAGRPRSHFPAHVRVGRAVLVALGVLHPLPPGPAAGASACRDRDRSLHHGSRGWAPRFFFSSQITSGQKSYGPRRRRPGAGHISRRLRHLSPRRCGRRWFVNHRSAGVTPCATPHQGERGEQPPAENGQREHADGAAAELLTHLMTGGSSGGWSGAHPSIAGWNSQPFSGCS